MKRDRRHERLLPIARWPSREEAAAMRWFQPLDAGRLQLRARTWVPAMVPWRATGEGEVTPAVLAWYRRFAEGRPGALVVEATGIRDVPSGPLLRIGHDRYLDGLRALVDTVREASAQNVPESACAESSKTVIQALGSAFAMAAASSKGR